MSALKSSRIHQALPAETEVSASDAASESPSVQLTTDLSQVNAMPSPALHLQDSLRQAWATPALTTEGSERKIPVGWALTAVLLGCGAFWACVAMVVF